MPRLSNAVPKYRKHRASGQAIVELAGKTHYLGPHGTRTSRTAYDRLIVEWLAAGRSPSFGAQSQELFLAELLAAFLAYAKTYYGRESKACDHLRRTAKNLRRLYGRTIAADFGPVEFKAIRQIYIAAGQSRLAELHAARKTPLSCGNRPGSNCVRRPRRSAGERYDTDSYRRAIHRACDKAGIDRWSPNRLRHSTATEIRSKYGLEAAQVILGHSKADTTQVYAERDYALAARVMQEVG